MKRRKMRECKTKKLLSLVLLLLLSSVQNNNNKCLNRFIAFCFEMRTKWTKIKKKQRQIKCGNCRVAFWTRKTFVGMRRLKFISAHIHTKCARARTISLCRHYFISVLFFSGSSSCYLLLSLLFSFPGIYNEQNISFANSNCNAKNDNASEKVKWANGKIEAEKAW